jgi:hypothetical protein
MSKGTGMVSSSVNLSLVSADEHYEKFVDHTFEGAWVDYHDPITNALQSVAQANLKFGGDGLFRQTTNPFLRSPVENTYNAFLNACSELNKVMGQIVLTPTH